MRWPNFEITPRGRCKILPAKIKRPLSVLHQPLKGEVNCPLNYSSFIVFSALNLENGLAVDQIFRSGVRGFEGGWYDGLQRQWYLIVEKRFCLVHLGAIFSIASKQPNTKIPAICHPMLEKAATLGNPPPRLQLHPSLPLFRELQALVLKNKTR